MLAAETERLVAGINDLARVLRQVWQFGELMDVARDCVQQFRLLIAEAIVEAGVAVLLGGALPDLLRIANGSVDGLQVIPHGRRDGIGNTMLLLCCHAAQPGPGG